LVTADMDVKKSLERWRNTNTNPTTYIAQTKVALNKDRIVYYKVAAIQVWLPHVTTQIERISACRMSIENSAQQFCVNVS
jgi:hypothetical protein